MAQGTFTFDRVLDLTPTEWVRDSLQHAHIFDLTAGDVLHFSGFKAWGGSSRGNSEDRLLRGRRLARFHFFRQPVAAPGAISLDHRGAVWGEVRRTSSLMMSAISVKGRPTRSCTPASLSRWLRPGGKPPNLHSPSATRRGARRPSHKHLKSPPNSVQRLRQVARDRQGRKSFRRHRETATQ